VRDNWGWTCPAGGLPVRDFADFLDPQFVGVSVFSRQAVLIGVLSKPNLQGFLWRFPNQGLGVRRDLIPCTDCRRKLGGVELIRRVRDLIDLPFPGYKKTILEIS